VRWSLNAALISSFFIVLFLLFYGVGLAGVTRLTVRTLGVGAYKAHLNLTTDGIKTMPSWAIDKKGDKPKIEGILSNELTTSEICVVLRSGNLIYLRPMDAYNNDCWSGKKDTSAWRSLYVLESSQLIGTWKR
jgi:hypothetical protein